MCIFFVEEVDMDISLITILQSIEIPQLSQVSLITHCLFLIDVLILIHT